MTPQKTGIARVIAATGHSMRGIRDCWEHEAAYRQDVILSLVLFIISFFIADTTAQWLHLVSPLFLLVIVESLNSAIEAVVDRIGMEYHDLSRRAKDIASAAVFFCLCLIVFSWSAIIWTNFLV